MKFRSVLLLLVASWTWSVPASAWSYGSHRLICEMAWLEMSPEERKAALQRLAPVHRGAFRDACALADEWRRQGKWRYTAPFHYMNIPRAPGAWRSPRCTDCIAAALPAMQALSGVFADSRTDATVPSRFRLTSSEAFVFLLHLVGDAHQPLHVGFADDRGGNLLSVTTGPRGRSRNFHEVWDDWLPCQLYGCRRKGPRGEDRLTHTAGLWQAEITDRERSAWIAGSVDDWLRESAELVRVIYADLPDDQGLDEEWVARHRNLTIQRIKQAAVRTANQVRLAVSSAETASNAR